MRQIFQNSNQQVIGNIGRYYNCLHLFDDLNQIATRECY